MKLSRLATASLLICAVFAAEPVIPDAAAQSRSGYEDVDTEPSGDWGQPQRGGYPNRGPQDAQDSDWDQPQRGGYPNQGPQDAQDGDWSQPQRGGYPNQGPQDAQDGDWGGAPPDDQGGGWGRAQQEIEQIITPEYRRMGMRLERLPNGSLRLRLPSEVMFAYDSANISPAFAPTLRKVAGFMERRPRTRARIIGHTDSVGSNSYNMDLSLRRAESVAAFLNGQGVHPRRLFTDGRGKQDPIASNATPEGRQMNRRVDIILLRPPRRY